MTGTLAHNRKNEPINKLSLQRLVCNDFRATITTMEISLYVVSIPSLAGMGWNGWWSACCLWPALLPAACLPREGWLRSSHCLCHLSLSFWVGKELVEKKSAYNDDLFASSFCMPPWACRETCRCCFGFTFFCDTRTSAICGIYTILLYTLTPTLRGKTGRGQTTCYKVHSHAHA